MSVHCDVIVNWGATPDELRALGAALWRWCSRTAGHAGLYPYLDNQALADLVAGMFPAGNWHDRQGVQVRIPKEPSQDWRATLACLRREIPAAGVKDLVVDGRSWNAPESPAPAP